MTTRSREVGISDLHYHHVRSRWETAESTPDRLRLDLDDLTRQEYLGDRPTDDHWNITRIPDPKTVRITQDREKVTIAVQVTYSWFDREPYDHRYDLTFGDFLAGRWSRAARIKHKDRKS